MGHAHGRLALCRSLSHRFVCREPPHGRAGRSCRQVERLVLVPDGAQRKRAHVCLVGSVQTLLQPAGMAAVVGTRYFENGSEVIVSLLLAQALEDCVKDLLRPFHDDAIDLVAGIDAMGFILGETLNKTLREWSVKCSLAVCVCVCMCGGFILRTCYSESMLDKKPNSTGETNIRSFGNRLMKQGRSDKWV